MAQGWGRQREDWCIRLAGAGGGRDSGKDGEMDLGDLYKRFAFEPEVREKAELHDRIRDLCQQVALNMDLILPDCRETSIVMTKIEEVMFWANSAVARHDVSGSGRSPRVAPLV
jgi:hypothetical protein